MMRNYHNVINIYHQLSQLSEFIYHNFQLLLYFDHEIVCVIECKRFFEEKQVEKAKKNNKSFPCKRRKLFPPLKIHNGVEKFLLFSPPPPQKKCEL